MRNRCLARAIADAGWGELNRQIAYKAQWARRTHIEVDRWFPSARRPPLAVRELRYRGEDKVGRIPTQLHVRALNLESKRLQFAHSRATF